VEADKHETNWTSAVRREAGEAGSFISVTGSVGIVQTGSNPSVGVTCDKENPPQGMPGTTIGGDKKSKVPQN